MGLSFHARKFQTVSLAHEENEPNDSLFLFIDGVSGGSVFGVSSLSLGISSRQYLIRYAILNQPWEVFGIKTLIESSISESSNGDSI